MLTISDDEDFRKIRRDFHAHPELKFEEVRTSEIIYGLLKKWGFDEIGDRLGKTGVVGVLHGNKSKKADSFSIGLRADMDALPLIEQNNFSHASKYPGKMHACGHDGHMATLLAAAKYISENREFSGTVNFIFQPGEEGGAGGKAMIEDGLFEKYPCSEIYAFHNWPGMKEGIFGFRKSAIMASSNQFNIVVHGKGGHAAIPQLCVDPIFVATQLCQAIYSIPSRYISPLDPVVITVSQINAGDSPNIIGDKCKLSGTVRTFSETTLENVETLLKKKTLEITKAFGAKAEYSFQKQYPPTINDRDTTEKAIEIAEKTFGTHSVMRDVEPTMGAEDFSFMLREVPGVYFFLGNGDLEGEHRDVGHGLGPCALHNSTYDFNDNLINIGARYWVSLVYERLAKR